MRLPRLVLVAVGAVVGLLVVMLGGEVAPLVLPRTVLKHPVEWSLAALMVARLGAEGVPAAAGRVGRVDAASAWVLRRGLSIGLAATAVVWLAMWLPHYPTWPWSRDVDAFAETAQAWSAGVLPYRDVRGYNFPGHIYLHAVIGRLFGWGRTGVYFLVDAALLLTLCGVVLAWSRRRLGGPAPGLAGCVVFLAAYLDMHMELVTERDWHAALGATLALLTLQTWPGRAGRPLSAATAAAAFVVRPHLVLFLPALALAAWRKPDDEDGDDDVAASRRRGLARVAEWGAAFAVFTAAGFLPLVLAGVFDEFVRGLRTASYGGPYSTFTPARGLAILERELLRPSTVALLAALTAMSVRGAWRRDALPWLAALLGALVYRPLHPVNHDYLELPLILVQATAWALPIAWLLREATAGGRKATLGLLATLCLLYQIIPMRFPYNCSFSAGLDAIRAAVGPGPGWTETAPPGAANWFGESRNPRYPWGDYNRMLDHVRRTTRPDAIVANVLKNPPFPAVNGPTGRRSPFRVESGIAWMWLVNEDLDETFARQLHQAGPGSIVVWSPGEVDSQPRLPLRRLTRTIREDYEPEARFGEIEVWRRKPESTTIDAEVK